MIVAVRTVPVSPNSSRQIRAARTGLCHAPTRFGCSKGPMPRCVDVHSTETGRNAKLEEARSGVLRLFSSVRHESMHFTGLIEAAYHGGNEQKEGDDDETFPREGTHGAVKNG